MHPAKNVGDDFYDVFALPEGKIGLAVADVSDKGVPAALYMMATKMTLKASALDHTQPAPVVTKVNHLLTEDNRSSMFVTLLYAVYDPATGHVTYTNAGHCNPLVVHPDGTASELAPTDGVVLGLVPGEPFEHKTATLMPGETLIIYSDGVTEAVNPDTEQLGMARLRQTFTASPTKLDKIKNLLHQVRNSGVVSQSNARAKVVVPNPVKSAGLFLRGSI